MVSKQLTCSILFFFLSMSFTFAETITTKTKEGKVKEKYSTDKDGKKSGTYTEFYENGKVKKKAVYKKGILNGKYSEFEKDGKIKFILKYRKGKQHGLQKVYTAGKLKSSDVWANGFLAYPRSIKEIKLNLNKIQRLRIGTEDIWPEDQIDKKLINKAIIRDNMDGLKKLMEYRYLSYVPFKHMKINNKQMAHCFAAVKLYEKIGGKAVRNPANPGIPQKEYQFALTGAQNSSRYNGCQMSAKSLVKLFIDGEEKQGPRMAINRKWFLNPTMGTMAFGIRSKHSAIWTYDKSNKKNLNEHDFTSLPGRGFYPNTHFSNNRAWTVTLNEKKFKDVDKQKLKITMYQLGKSFKKAKDPTPLIFTEAEVSLNGRRTCITFLPEKFSILPRIRYQVEIKGLKLTTGEDTSIKYLVEFF